MKQLIRHLRELHPNIGDTELRRILVDFTLDELIDIWDEADHDERLRIFALIEQDMKIDLINELSPSHQEELLKGLSEAHIRILLDEIEPDDLADIMQTVSPEVRESVWQSLSDDAKKETEFLLRYDEEHAAGIMTPRYLAVRSGLSVSQAISFLRKSASNVETVYYIYVVDQLKRLLGVISLRDLLSAADDEPVAKIMEQEIISVREDTDQEIAAKTLERYSLIALPVVDAYNRLLGIITFDDVIDVIREEQTEDVYKMGAMDGSTEKYLDTSIFRLIRKRIPWLIFLLLAGTITTNVLSFFEPVSLAAAFLALFIPVITQSGGNSGTQSSTLMIRGIATGEIHFADLGRILSRELLIGVLMGIILGTIIIIRSVLLPPGISITDAVIVGSSLVFVIVFSTVIGAAAPLIIHRLGFDPTVMAGPLMATVIDVCGLTIYFEIARIILNL